MKKIKIIIGLVILIAVVSGIAVLFAIRAGKIDLGAETEYCQNSSRLGVMYGSSRWAVAANLVRVNFVGHSVMVNKKAAPYFNKVSRAIIKRGLNKVYKFRDVQTWNWRTKKPAGVGQSLHSYGIAMDINPSANPYVYTTSKNFQTDIPKEVITIFKQNGFFWGGDWGNFKDPMHFEWYGAQIKGKLESTRGKRVGQVKIYLGDKLVGKFKDNYNIAIPSGTHRLVFKTKNYGNETFKVRLRCNDIVTKNVKFNPLSAGPPGRIVGTVIFPKKHVFKSPADVYLDGSFAIRTDAHGKYSIPTVASGFVHHIEIRLFPLLRGGTYVKVMAGKTVVADPIRVK